MNKISNRQAICDVLVEKAKNVDTVVFEKDNISENADFVKQLIEVIAKSTYNFELLPDIIDDLRGNNTVLI